MTILWPPPYYLLRDRIPVFLTVIYMNRHHIPTKYQGYMGWGLEAMTIGGLFTALIMWVYNGNMEPLLGFRWSIPSPIEWSLLVIFSSMRLYGKGLDLFKAYYIALLTALGGGWLYEILYGMPFWVESGFAHWNLFKLNANKVLYFEFQVISLPLVLYLLTQVAYRRHRLAIPMLLGAVMFYLGNHNIRPIISHIGGNYSFLWVLRVPMILFLWLLLEGVQKMETKEVKKG